MFNCPEQKYTIYRKVVCMSHALACTEDKKGLSS